MVYPVSKIAPRRPIEVELYASRIDIDSYCNAMEVTGYHDAVLCRVFLLTLKKEALKWFKELPPRSITSWDALAYQFVHYFITSKELSGTSHILALVKQDKGEKLRDFLTRFYMETALVPNLGPDIILHLIVQALALGPFKCSLAKTFPKTMHEFCQRSKKYVNLEDTTLDTLEPIQVPTVHVEQSKRQP